MTTTTMSVPRTQPTSAKSLFGRGALAGAVASVATASVAGIAHAAGVSLAVGGKAIPVAGFAQLTFAFTMVGAVLAFALRSRATFVKTAVVLTALSLVPDALADAHTSTRLLLALTHIVAAVIVIPALASARNFNR